MRKHLLILYRTTKLGTLKLMIYDLLNQYEDTSSKEEKKLLSKLLDPAISVYIKYSCSVDEEMVQFTLDNNIPTDCTYEGTH